MCKVCDDPAHNTEDCPHGDGIEYTVCPGSGEALEVFEQRLKKQGITYTYVGGSVYCPHCKTYVRLHDPHSVPVAQCPSHLPGEVRPRRQR